MIVPPLSKLQEILALRFHNIIVEPFIKCKALPKNLVPGSTKRCGGEVNAS